VPKLESKLKTCELKLDNFYEIKYLELI